MHCHGVIDFQSGESGCSLTGDVGGVKSLLHSAILFNFFPRDVSTISSTDDFIKLGTSIIYVQGMTTPGRFELLDHGSYPVIGAPFTSLQKI